MFAEDQIVYTDRNDRNKGDDQLNVTFYDRDVDNVMCEFIRIQVPGDTTLVIDEYATDYHRQRFSKKYEMYKTMSTETGTDIGVLDMSPSMQSEFKNMGFRFVEQLASAPDSAFARLMGGFSWRLKAKTYLMNHAPKSEKEMKYEEEINQLKSQMAELLAAVNSSGDQAKPARAQRKIIELE